MRVIQSGHASRIFNGMPLGYSIAYRLTVSDMVNIPELVRRNPTVVSDMVFNRLPVDHILSTFCRPNTEGCAQKPTMRHTHSTFGLLQCKVRQIYCFLLG
jgi:hypothetical protein